MAKQTESISIVVPALNEAESLPLLLKRIHKPLTKASITYEVIIVDDRSTDDTVSVIKKISKVYPVKLLTKVGERGKALSLLQGFAAAQYPVIVMIDADLQYPPEAIIPMYKLLQKTNVDIVITDREEYETSALRELSSKVFSFIFTRMLFGIKFDAQSGLKLFRSYVLDDIELTPSPWSFDLEFLVRALESKRTIISYTIPFAKREAGATKIRLLSATTELATSSLKLRFNTSAKKIRAGHKANAHYLKAKLFIGLLALTFVIGSTGQHTKVSAVSIPVGSVVNQAADLTVPVSSSLSSHISTVFPQSAGNGSSIQSSDAPQQNGTSAPAAESTQSGSTPQSQTTSDAPSSLSKSSILLADSQSPTASSNGTIDLNGTSTDTSQLTAATVNEKSSGLFANGYPVYALSHSTTNALWVAVRFVFLTGLLLIVGYMISLGLSRHKRYTDSKV